MLSKNACVGVGSFEVVSRARVLHSLFPSAVPTAILISTGIHASWQGGGVDDARGVGFPQQHQSHSQVARVLALEALVEVV